MGQLNEPSELMKKILIVSDNDNRCDAIPRGLQLARKLGCKAEVVGFAYAPLRKIGAKTKVQLEKPYAAVEVQPG